jgi:hypothetical protein
MFGSFGVSLQTFDKARAILAMKTFSPEGVREL